MQRPYRLPSIAQQLPTSLTPASLTDVFKAAWAALLAFAVSATIINATLPLLQTLCTADGEPADVDAASSGELVRLLSHVIARFQHSLQMRDFLARCWQLLSAAVEKQEQARKEAEEDAALPSFCKSATQLLEEAERPPPAEAPASRWLRQLLQAMELAPRVHPQLLALMLRVVHEAPATAAATAVATGPQHAPSPLPLASATGGCAVGRAGDDAARRLPLVQLYILATAAPPSVLSAPAAPAPASDSSAPAALVALWSRLGLGADLALTLASQLHEQDGPHTLREAEDGDSDGDTCLSFTCRSTARALRARPVLRALAAFGAGALWFESAARDVVQGVEYGETLDDLGGTSAAAAAAEGASGAGTPSRKKARQPRSSGNVAVLGVVSAAAGGDDAPAHSILVKRKRKEGTTGDDAGATPVAAAAASPMGSPSPQMQQQDGLSDATSATSSAAPSPFSLAIDASASNLVATPAMAAPSDAATTASAETPSVAPALTPTPTPTPPLAASSVPTAPPKRPVFASLDLSSLLAPALALDVGANDGDGSGSGTGGGGREALLSRAHSAPRYPHRLLAREVPLLSAAHHALVAWLVEHDHVLGRAGKDEAGALQGALAEDVADLFLEAIGAPVPSPHSAAAGAAAAHAPLSLGPFAFANLFNVYQVRRDNQQLMAALLPRRSLDTAADALVLSRGAANTAPAAAAAADEQESPSFTPTHLAKLRLLQRLWAPQVSRCSDGIAALQALEVTQALSCLPRGGGVSPASLLAPLRLPVPGASAPAAERPLSLSRVLALHSHLLRLYVTMVSSGGGGGSGGGACPAFYPDFMLRTYVRRVVPVMQAKLRQLVAHQFRPQGAAAGAAGAAAAAAAVNGGEDAERLEQELLDEEALAAAVEDSAADMLSLASEGSGPAGDGAGGGPVDPGALVSPVAQLLWVSLARSTAPESLAHLEYLLSVLSDLAHRRRSHLHHAQPLVDELHPECKGVGFANAAIVFETVAHGIVLALCAAVPLADHVDASVGATQLSETKDVAVSAAATAAAATAASADPPPALASAVSAGESSPPAIEVSTAAAEADVSPEFVAAFQSLHRCEHELRELLSIPLAAPLAPPPPTVATALRAELAQLRRDVDAAHAVYQLARFKPLDALHAHVYESLVPRGGGRGANSAGVDERRMSERQRGAAATAASIAAAPGGHAVPPLRPRPASFFLAALGSDVHALERVRLAREREAVVRRPSPPLLQAPSRAPSLPTVRPVRLSSGSGTRDHRPAPASGQSAASSGSGTSRRREHVQSQRAEPLGAVATPASVASSPVAAAPARRTSTSADRSSARKRLKLESMAAPPRRARDRDEDEVAASPVRPRAQREPRTDSSSLSRSHRRSAQKRKAQSAADGQTEFRDTANEFTPSEDDDAATGSSARVRRARHAAVTATASPPPMANASAALFDFPLSDDDE